MEFQLHFSNPVKFVWGPLSTRVCPVQPKSNGDSFWENCLHFPRFISGFFPWSQNLLNFFFQREQYRLVLSPIATVGQETPRHRRQLRFADAEIKLKRDIVYHNLQNGHETCKSSVSATKLSFTTSYRKKTMTQGHSCTVKSENLSFTASSCTAEPAIYDYSYTVKPLTTTFENKSVIYNTLINTQLTSFMATSLQ